MNRWVLALVLGSSAALAGWEQAIGGADPDEARAVATNCDSIYVGGYLASPGLQTGLRTPDAGTYHGNRDAFVARFRPDGGLVWLSYYGGTQDEVVESLDIDPSGHVLAAGYTFSREWPETSTQSASGRDGFLLKISPSGEVIWGRKIEGQGSSDDSVEGISPAGAAGAYFCGHASAGATRDAGTWDAEWQGGQDAIVGFVDPAGIVQWVDYFGGDGDDIAHGIAADPAGGAIVIGDTQANRISFPTTRLPPFVDPTPDAGSRDIFLLRVNETGARSWAYTLGGNSIDLGNAVISAGGAFYACGGAGSGGFGTVSGSGDTDMLIMQLDGNGFVQGILRAGGSARDECLDVAVAPNGDVYAAGWTISTAYEGEVDNKAPSASGANVQVVQVHLPGFTRGKIWVRGGLGDDRGFGGVYLDDHYYVAGQTFSPDFPVDRAGRTDLQGFLLALQVDAGTGCGPPAGEVDAGTDAGTADAGTEPTDAGFERRPALGWSCGCASGGGPLFAALGLALVLLARRSRRAVRHAVKRVARIP